MSPKTTSFTFPSFGPAAACVSLRSLLAAHGIDFLAPAASPRQVPAPVHGNSSGIASREPWRSRSGIRSPSEKLAAEPSATSRAVAAGLNVGRHPIRSRYAALHETGWSVGEVRSHVAAIAKLAGLTEDELLASVASGAGEEEAERAARVAAEQATYDAALDEFTRTLLLPTESEIRNASRWDSHLERSLCRMMDRLERIQRMRAGEFVSAPALVEISVDRE